jgi:hypothetical protein
MGGVGAAHSDASARRKAEAQSGNYQWDHAYCEGRLPLARLSGGYGPHTTIDNRFNRWSRDGIWQKMLEALVDPGSSGSQSIDSTTSKAHRCAAGGKGGPKSRQSDAAAAGGRPRSMPSPTPLAV